MQSREIISRSKNVFRELRKGNEKNINDIVKESGVAWSTVKSVLQNMVKNNIVKETGNKTKTGVVLNPKSESFSGVYIAGNTIYLSVVDFYGKKIHSTLKQFDDSLSFQKVLQEILQELKKFKNLKAVSICCDEYFEESTNDGMVYPTSNYCLRPILLDYYIPKGVEYYVTKTCITTSYWWCDTNDVSEIRDEDLNVIFSFSKDKCYYTIMANSQIIQKREIYGIKKDEKSFLDEIIIPIWKIINPNNMIFIVPDDPELKFIKENISNLSQEIIWKHWTINKDFERREPTKLIAKELQCPSEGAAIYAMYRYYGWAK